MLSGLGNFMVDFHIQSSSSSSVFANKVPKKQSAIWIRRHYDSKDHAVVFDKGGRCHVF